MADKSDVKIAELEDGLRKQGEKIEELGKTVARLVVDLNGLLPKVKPADAQPASEDVPGEAAA